MLVFRCEKKTFVTNEVVGMGALNCFEEFS
jgi:hypothetical protein